MADDDLARLVRLIRRDLGPDLAPRLTELCEILQLYLDTYLNNCQPNYEACIQLLKELREKCLNVKEGARVAKIVGSSLGIASASTLIGLGIAAICVPIMAPVIIGVTVTGGTLGAGGIVTSVASSAVEMKSDKDIAKQIKELIKKHLDDNQTLNEIMAQFESKYDSLLEYLEEIGLDNEILSTTLNHANTNAIPYLRAYSNHFQREYTRINEELDENLNFKFNYFQNVCSFLIHIKCFFENVALKTKELGVKLVEAITGRGLKLPPGIFGFMDDGANALGAVGKFGLGLGIAFNALGLAVGIYDVVNESIKECSKDKLIVGIDALLETLQVEKNIFQEHLDEIAGSTDKFKELKDIFQ